MSESPVHSSAETGLSSAGIDRRQRMLDELIGEMRRVHRRRRVLRHAAIALTPVVVLGVIVLAMNWPRGVPTSPQGQGPTGGSVASLPKPAPLAKITLVRTGDDIVDRYRVQGGPGAVQSLSDAELLETLAALDRPAGIVRSGGAARLTRDVSDAPNASPPPTSS